MHKAKMAFLKATTIARLEGTIRPLMTKLPASLAVAIYSKGRIHFLKKLHHDIPKQAYEAPKELHRTLWGLKFHGPLMNAAGIYKNGECFQVCQAQGAAGFLGGTSTELPRKGNKKGIIHLPFAPFPRSHSAANWLGLPNKGYETNAKAAAKLKKQAKIPIGWSLMGAPEKHGEDKLKGLIEGLTLFDRAGIDFLEINESCPNTEEGKPQDNDLAKRLTFIKQQFLDKRVRNLPVIVKFSTDTEPEQITALMELLFQLGFDGVNFGNTSTEYKKHRDQIDPSEQKLYDQFTSKFGGGISGAPLRKSSLQLAALAVEHLKKHPPKQEFHVIRTGGIETGADIEASEKAGISLNQWYTGYFEQFAHSGHNIYKNLYHR